MALTTDDLLVRVQLDSSGAIKGFVDLQGNLVKIAASAEKSGSQAEAALGSLDAATLAVIESTRALAIEMEESGKSGFQVEQARIAAKSEEIAYLKSLASLNGTLSTAMAYELDLASKITEEFAKAKFNEANVALVAKLADQTKALVLETELLGKTEAEVGEIQKRVALEKIADLEKQLAAEGRLTTEVMAQLDAQKAATTQLAGAKAGLLQAAEAEAAALKKSADATAAWEAATHGATAADAHATAEIGHHVKGLESFGGSLIVLNEGIELAHKAWELFGETIVESVKEFRLAEDYVKRLSLSLEILGDKDVEGTVAQFRAFSNELHETTTATKEQSLHLLGLARQMGLNNEKTEELVETANDVAAAYGETLETAFGQLTQSLKGQVRGLAQLRPELAGAGKEWAKAGGAVKYFSDLVGGRAKAELQTFGGQLKQNKKIFEEFQKALGEGVMIGLGLNPDDSVQLAKLNEHLDDFKLAITVTTSAVKGFLLIIKDLFMITINTILAPIDLLSDAFLTIVKTVKSFDLSKMLGALNDLAHGNFSAAAEKIKGSFDFKLETKHIKELGQNFKDEFKDIYDQATFTGGAIDQTTEATKKLKNETKKPPKLPPIISEDGLRTLDELRKKVAQLGMESQKAAANEFDQIRLKAASGFEELGLLEAKLVAEKALTKEAKAQIALARDFVSQGVETEIAAAAKAKFDESRKANAELAIEVLGFGDDEVAVLNAQLRLQEDLLDIEIDKLKATGDEGMATMLNLMIQKDLLKTVAARKKLEAELGKVDPAAASVGRGVGAALQMGSDALVKTAGLFGKELSGVTEATVNKVIVVSARVFDKVLPAVDALLSVALAVFSPDVIQGFADWIDQLSKLPDSLMKAFNNLDKVIGSFINKFPALITKLVDGVPAMIDKILAALPQLISALMKGLLKIVDMLPGIFEKLFQALPKLLEEVLKKLPELIKHIFSAIGEIIASLMKALPDIFKELFDHLPDIIEAIIEGLLGAVGTIISAAIDDALSGGFEKFAGSLLRMIPRIIVAIVVGVGKGLVEMFKNIFSGVKIKNPAGDLAATLQDSVKKVLNTATSVTDQVFKVIDINAAARGQSAAEELQKAVLASTQQMERVTKGLIQTLIDAWRKIYDNILRPFVDALSAVWTQLIRPIIDTLVNGLSAVWNGLIKPIVDALVDGLRASWEALTQLWTTTVRPILDGFVAGLSAAWAALGVLWKDTVAPVIAGFLGLWDSIVGSLRSVFSDVIKPILTGYQTFLSSFKDLVGQLGANLGKSFTDAFASIKTFFTDLLKGNVVAAFKSVTDYFTSLPGTLSKGVADKFAAIGDSFKALGEKIFGGLKDQVVNGWEAYYHLGATIFNGLKDSLSGIANIFEDLGKSIWNGLASSVKSASSSGGGALSSLAAKVGLHSKGGPIYAAEGMMIPHGTDVVPAMLSPGEYIVSAGAAGRLGRNYLDAINSGSAPRNGGGGGGGGGPQSVTQTYQINVRVDGSKAVDEKALAAAIMERIKKDSFDGKIIISSRGIAR